MNSIGIFGKFKIRKGGLCLKYYEYEHLKNGLDPQLISGFSSALISFTKNLFGEDLRELITDNYKILFKNDSKFLNVYIVENSFKDYDILNQDIHYDDKDILNSPVDKK
ncbi:MAG: hypothetical protein GF329_04285 [Candidatus Lokiarchaeota archaeon]|nr:hypothetical protein [Candidatus Lokiarchaeota archaeon]